MIDKNIIAPPAVYDPREVLHRDISIASVYAHEDITIDEMISGLQSLKRVYVGEDTTRHVINFYEGYFRVWRLETPEEIIERIEGTII